MSDCHHLRVVACWECPRCGRQTVDCEGEAVGYHGRPYVCSDGHRTVEMEQKNPEAFRTALQ